MRPCHAHARILRVAPPFSLTTRRTLLYCTAQDEFVPKKGGKAAPKAAAKPKAKQSREDSSDEDDVPLSKKMKK
jgi:hypothetical protein